ncbi:MAG: alpha/beta hydrolase, partial [Bacteroidota bacterium]
KNNFIAVEICKELSRKGYAAASVNYRIAPDYFKSKQDLVNVNLHFFKQVTYNAVRDARAAIRYFKANADDLQIDPNNIFLAGFSAGAITALHLSFLDQGEADEFFDGQTFGLLDEVDNLGGKIDFRKDELRGVIAIGGGMLYNLNKVIDDSEKIPLLLFHGEDDKIVPFQSGKPFDKFVKDYKLGLPGIEYELGISTKHEDGNNDKSEVAFRSSIVMTEGVFRGLQKFLPDVYGSKMISREVGRRTCSLESYHREGHTFMRDKKNGEVNRNFGRMINQIIKFIRENTR